MREFVRNKLRAEGERLEVKPSRYVAHKFDRHQVKKYGETVRRINQAKGTHKRNTWRNRIAIAV